MRQYLLAVVVLGSLAACGGDPGAGGKDQCDGVTVVPPPEACMTACDATPGAPATCPGGFHCSEDGTCQAFCTQGGEECNDGNRCTPDGRCVGNDECIGLECQVVDCDAMGMPQTTISGTVFAPNGTLPLFGVNVYVPNVPVGPPPDGVVCDKCGDTLPGYPLSLIQTDDAGRFTLTGVPAGANVPVILQSGKWRREILLSNVTACGDTPLTAEQTRFPRTKVEGYMPKIALTTGNADSLECLIRKLGIADSEITTGTGTGSVNFYAGNGVAQFAAGHAGGAGPISTATDFWDDPAQLNKYDIVFLSCEGGQNPDTKPQTAIDAMVGYANSGGRVFASHWHNIWIEGATDNDNDGQAPPASWTGLMDWNNSNTTFGGAGSPDTIRENGHPKGTSFANWMLNVGGSPAGMRGVVPIQGGTGKNTVNSILDPNNIEEWVYWQQGGNQRPQMVQFTTPQGEPERCGKVVFTDMHVSGDPGDGDYPTSCGMSTTLTEQEKALAFMFFDLASCVQAPIL